MQNNIVKALRQRLVSAGFEDIFIYYLSGDRYLIYCTSRHGERIRRNITLVEMRATSRTVWFD